ncbi:hypothetical protein RHGRI_037969 [Rhododendron griersonianum]|uniref:Uncharacterized protein n=1 Tax=Rhododendron griersonianum TaxID=479676 RepID=A0AAV6HTU9_9ERIC|nr:hypothetical protein RHGRI_037969 [Rhododendron griersonianum]
MGIGICSLEGLSLFWETEQLGLLLQKIQSFRIDDSRGDVLQWRWNQDRTFSVKSAYSAWESSISPALHDIDQVGTTPGVQCKTKMLNSPPKERDVMWSPLEADSCIMVAEHELDIKESEGAAL